MTTSVSGERRTPRWPLALVGRGSKLAAVLLVAASAHAANFHGVIYTGQSLCAGSGGSPALSTTQPYNNNTPWSGGFNPLVESGAETPASASANELNHLVGNGNYITTLYNGCSGGLDYNALKKGTTPYSTALLYMQAAYNNRGANAFTVDALQITHGETDDQEGTTEAQYKADLLQWRSDYENDVKAITGQSNNVQAFVDQMSTWTYNHHTTPTVALAQWDVARDYPGQFYLVGPKYQYTYYSDGLHMINTSYRLLGEMYGKAKKKVLVDGQQWWPLSPKSITLSGSTITLKCNVPAGSIVRDTTTVAARAHDGFEFAQTGGNAVSISSVTITAPDIITIALSAVPTGTNLRLRYAYTGTSGAGGGTSGAAAGNIRDDDSTVGLDGSHLYDWMITFDQPITAAPPCTSACVTVGGGVKLGGGVTVP